MKKCLGLFVGMFIIYTDLNKIALKTLSYFSLIGTQLFELQEIISPFCPAL